MRCQIRWTVENLQAKVVISYSLNLVGKTCKLSLYLENFNCDWFIISKIRNEAALFKVKVGSSTANFMRIGLRTDKLEKFG